MVFKNINNSLVTGTVFTVKNKLGGVGRYCFQGIDMTRLDGGVGCDYIILQDMEDAANCFGVEAAWFTQREITIEGPSPEIRPVTYPGYTVVDSCKVGEKEIVICKTQEGNRECTAPYVIWEADQIGCLAHGRQVHGCYEAAQWQFYEMALKLARPIAKQKYRDSLKEA